MISSQGVHDRFGGVVPEIASRHHLTLLPPVIDEALRTAGATLDDVELVAATRGPGLVAALLVGFCAAKALAAARELPFAPVDHLHGHLAASFLKPSRVRAAVPGADRKRRSHAAGGCERPRSRAAAAGPDARRRRRRGLRQGRAAARPRLSRRRGARAAGRDGDPEAFDFPTAERMAGLDFSFAGLKTALLYKVRELGEREARAPPRRPRRLLPARDRRGAADSRPARARRQTGATRLAVGGGVAANGPLRERLAGLGSSSTSRRARCAPTTRR